MRKSFKWWLLVVNLGLASPLFAQQARLAGVAPVVEGGIGYSYTTSDIPAEGTIRMNGVIVSASGDLTAHFGAKVQVGYSRSRDAFQTGRSADILTYMGGPVFYPVRRRKFNIYAQVLVGAAKETGVNFESDGTLVRGFVNQFAWAGGAGFQYRISRALSLRPEVEYLRTSFFNANVAIETHPNVRTSISLVCTLGRRE
jgi:opacity protein-like surface antigen